MFCNILRKKLVLESLYIWRLSSKVTPALLFSSEFCWFFKDTYLVENLRTVTSDRGSFSRIVWRHSWGTSSQDSKFWPPSSLSTLVSSTSRLWTKFQIEQIAQSRFTCFLSGKGTLHKVLPTFSRKTRNNRLSLIRKQLF